ncbi:hypothetical protein AYL99_04822 [Fonsecaea erecta]|uniref:Uncharacterized protein n=1 Tax=Fonsecaea erecta TaxID=1367422 RepID=A0A178ZJ52_9EURO|nr:hypothetical protein AYL99_04822 [Fonsecaea erecta]OAP59820.1 hypothetical protein AYL99_04822 [Fonsecaea erecta]
MTERHDPHDQFTASISQRTCSRGHEKCHGRRGGYDESITYERANPRGELELGPTSYDFVFATLRPGGRFVFSIEHPVLTAPADASWHRDVARGMVFWPLNQYWDEGVRVTDWLAEGVRK